MICRHRKPRRPLVGGPSGTFMWLALVMSVALVGSTRPALAGPAEDLARARNAFTRGQTPYSAGRYQDALANFELSLSLEPHPNTIFNIARCQAQLGDLVASMTSYKEDLRLSPEATDADITVTAIASIEGRLQAGGQQHVLVYAEPATTSVSLDGKVIGTSPASAAIPPGNHRQVIAALNDAKAQAVDRVFAATGQRADTDALVARQHAAPALFITAGLLAAGALLLFLFEGA
jgi:tetratricopeptide (TPR) repeat protein